MSEPTNEPSSSNLASDGTVKHVKIITINNGEEVRVSEDALPRYSFGSATALNSAAFRCSNCKLLTVQTGYALGAHLVMPETVEEDQQDTYPPVVSKRVYGCTNCGRITTK